MENRSIIYSIISFLAVCIVLIGCQSKKGDIKGTNEVIPDSIRFYLDRSQNKTNIKRRKADLLKAYELNREVINDSIKNRNLLDIAFQAYRQEDTVLFRKFNREAQLLSIKIKDTFGIADTHWNFGNYFSKKEIIDSTFFHYSKAEEFFHGIGDEYSSAKMLYNLGVIQARIRDYTGSEIQTFKAISKFKKLDKPLRLYKCYNQLGVIYKELKEYDRAIVNYEMALDYLKDVPGNHTNKESTLNNMGLAYRNSGEYELAINYFGEALSNDSLKQKNIILYATLADNLTYTRFLNGESQGLEESFLGSLKLRDSINNLSGIVINKLHLAEFYANQGDTVKAIGYGKESNDLARKTNNNRDYLASLKFLSTIDKANSASYLRNYVHRGDSLQMEDRKTREKFTRIRFQTDEYVEETERLAQQRIWITIIGLVTSLMFLFLYFLKRQHSRNKDLIFETKQQAYNEEIYKLMLKQEANLKKGRLDERNRISEELHDGVLSKLFGTRMGIGFLDLKGDEETLEKHQSLIDELQQVEKEIRVISHELKNDVLSSQISFISLIESLTEKHSDIGNFKYEVSADSSINWDEIDEKTKIHLYRIIQEGLSNICKYSKAKIVNINFKLLDNLLKLSIVDDGVGFDKNKKKKGIGLLNMNSRIEKLNGKFILDSNEGHGTKLSVSIHI